MNDYIFKVEDMTCGGCASRIQNALNSSEQVSNVDIDVSKQLVTVSTAAEQEAVADIIKAAGYTPKAVSKGLFGKMCG